MTNDVPQDDSAAEEALSGDPVPDEAPAVSAGALLRQALVDDDDPRFPLWLPLPGLAAAAGWAAYDAVAMSGDFVGTLLWPGVAIFALATLAAWFGWQLEIDD